MMHSIRKVEDTDEWQIIFVSAEGEVVGALLPHYKTQDEAMGFCSYLNGGMDPRGYHLEVTCHY